MQISQNKSVEVIKKVQKSPSFQANPAVEKVVKTAKDEALKIAGAAATAIGAAAIAIAKKDDSIESIEVKTSPDKNVQGVEVLEPLSVKDVRKIFKKLGFKKELIERFHLEDELARKLFATGISIYNCGLANECANLEDALDEIASMLVAAHSENSPERQIKKIEELTEMCEGYKYLTTNNIAKILETTSGDTDIKKCFHEESFIINIPKTIDFLKNYESIAGEKFNREHFDLLDTGKLPTAGEIKAIKDLLKNRSDIKLIDIINITLEEAKDPKVLDKIALKKEFPNIPASFIQIIATSDADIIQAKNFFQSLSKIIKDIERATIDKERYQRTYYMKHLLEVCKNLNSEKIDIISKLMNKTIIDEINYLNKIKNSLTTEKIKTFSVLAEYEGISFYNYAEVVQNPIELINPDDLKTYMEECTDRESISEKIIRPLKGLNTTNAEIFFDVLRGFGNNSYPAYCSLQSITPINISIAKKLLAENTLCSMNSILNCITENNIDCAEKLIEKYKNNKEIILAALKTANATGSDFINEVLSDERFIEADQKEKFVSTSARFFAEITEHNADFIKELYKKTKDKERGIIQAIAQATNEKNINIAKEWLTDENLEKLISETSPINFYVFTQILNKTTEDNAEVAKYLLENKAKICSVLEYETKYVEAAQKILTNCKGCEDFVKEQLEQNILLKHPEIINIETDCWETALERNYLDNYMNYKLINLYSRCDEDITSLHPELVKDAFAKRDLLKSGTEDLPDYKINSVFNSPETVKALDFVGKTNLEAAFPLMIDNFEDLTVSIANFIISDENKELLIKTIRPTKTPEYKALKKEINELKKLLNELVGKENLAKINKLKEQQAEILTMLEPLKAEYKAKQSECKENPTPELEVEIQKLKEKIKSLEAQAKAFGSQAQSVYFQSENSAQIKEVMKNISIKTKEAQRIADSAKMLEPREIITKLRVLITLSQQCTDEEMRSYIEMIKPSVEDKNKAWNNAINKKVFEKIGIEFDENLSEKLKFSECKYLSELFVSSSTFFRNLKNLIKVIQENPELSIEEALDTIPENKETKEMLENLGIDYHAWTRVNKESRTKVEIKLNAEQARSGAIKSLEEDLNDLQFKTLPDKIKNNIWIALAEIGVTFEKSYRDVFVGDGFNAGQEEFWKLYKDGQPIVFDDMPKIISTIKRVINNDEFWSKTHYDSNIETARSTMYEHLTKLRTAEVDNAKGLKDEEVHEIEIRKTDMYDIKKSLGLGNDGQCCTSLGRFNDWSAPNYIMYKCIGALELVDNGNFVGNTMIFIAMVDGEPALILDNIELKTKYQNNDKIRDAFMEYAKKLCAEIGKPDMAIYAGPNRHKLNMSIYPKEVRKMTPIGSTGTDKVYMDYRTSGQYVNGKTEENVKLYKIR